ncbi:pre-piRNA 3'-exonuclease trimmer [Microplitis demolitor]|uniref:pre-piRNA 3'-exonuclease trimmer n=1 Tax=Microplitis demolitor TaxID=69319 RepID=UPI0004CD332C|nr:pre-piRNA 3'-exonuclease trimmer [Microplitis demolitor]
MNEILDNNFINNYDKIKLSLKNATFIAIDAEFSGIKEENVADLSLFDTMPQRYKKLRENINSFIAIQLGISTFKYIRDDNKYNVDTYNFYLLPRQLPFDDRQFLWQVGALEFLTRHNFNFNKLNYHGISYLDEEKEIKLRDTLKVNDYINNYAIFSNSNDESVFSTAISDVAKWLKDSKSERSIELKCNNIAQQCYIQRELRSSFKSIWTESKDQLSILVIKVDAQTREALEEVDNNSLENKIIDYYLGFTKVFKLLVDLKKPIIGHNALLDLMFIYKQFYRPLPSNYLDFKKEIHKIFPCIYDTKFISYELKRKLDTDSLKSNILQELYHFFISAGHILVIDSPKIEFSEPVNSDKEIYHDAGWDSYYSGYCFIKTAYVHAIKKRGLRDGLIELTNSEIFYGVHEYVNCVNVIRADLSYIKLDGPDPKSTRPPWLNIRTKKIYPINISEISEELSPFGSLAIKPHTRESVLVATSNYRTAREILDHFQRSKDYRVALYNPLRHSLISKSIIWSGFVLTSGLLTWLIHSRITRS